MGAWYKRHVIRDILQWPCYRGNVMKDMLWGTCYKGHVIEDMLWGACYKGHVMGTCYKGHVMGTCYAGYVTVFLHYRNIAALPILYNQVHGINETIINIAQLSYYPDALFV